MKFLKRSSTDTKMQGIAGLATAQELQVFMKKLAARSWMRFDPEGGSMLLEADKYAIMHRVGIHARDLRILDPLLSYPSTILGRERAIVLNLEHIRAIITADEMLLRNPSDENVIPFVEELRRRLPARARVQPRGRRRRGGDAGVDYDSDTSDRGNVDDDAEVPPPFEFRALEAALEAICSFLDARAQELENSAMPSLEQLTVKITPTNLEKVRKSKTVLTRLTARVHKVRDELEQLLEDDGDMADMFLTRKMQSVPSPNASVSNNWFPTSPTIASRFSTRPSAVSRASTVATAHDDDVEELEQLLESYFMQVDGTLNKLNTLREFIDDTEDYINIQLDKIRNELIQLELILSTITVVVGLAGVVAGIFGMNVPLPQGEDDSAFEWILIITGLACTFVWFAIFSYARYKGLIGL
eukprot:TRINITY_DN23564_c0_g1_i1.p1 TRINITY_DN23564_c0_g1~~TRINITY_DN23564_c0_g1_i1.p1  ORF type:complete len:414 (+),score=72.13 TRINITY_DN23564_c0_g1_i1:282-1523(+)